MHTTPVLSPSSGPSDEDQQYARFLETIRERFAVATANTPHLFTVAHPFGSPTLYDAFLAGLPAERRQHYDCRACRRFVDTYGGLVVIDKEGVPRPALWAASDTPPFFKRAVMNLMRATIGKTDGIFYADEPTWGLPMNHQQLTAIEHGRTAVVTWHHMHVVPRAGVVQPDRRPTNVTAFQAMAEKKQDFETLSRALGDFNIETLKQAKALLESDALYRSEKVLGVATWLVELAEARAVAKARIFADNLTWLAVASAPAGFCHVRSTMIGTLLEDLAAGKPFEDVKRAFAAKMHPMQYQRPTAAPSAGNIAQAEKLVAQLRTSGSLVRRYARLDDVLPYALWKPAPPKTDLAAGAKLASGVFGHLLPKKDRGPVDSIAPPQVMTWVKFRTTVLPTAEAIEMFTPDFRAPFFSMVTALDPTSPPVLQWDLAECRNPVSWYFHLSGSIAEEFGLRRREYVPVEAVTLQPNQWSGDGFAHQGDGAFFILRGCQDKQPANGGLFVECLKSEYHGVRATLEAHLRTSTIAGAPLMSACGIALQKSGKVRDPYTLRVTAGGVRSVYKIDRWD